jgi:hypothetical protein
LPRSGKSLSTIPLMTGAEEIDVPGGELRKSGKYKGQVVHKRDEALRFLQDLATALGLIEPYRTEKTA